MGNGGPAEEDYVKAPNDSAVKAWQFLGKHASKTPPPAEGRRPSNNSSSAKGIANISNVEFLCEEFLI